MKTRNLLLLCCVVLQSCYSISNGDHIKNANQCIKSYFSTADTERREYAREEILPLEPWVFIAELPETPPGMSGISALKLIQHVDGSDEIWIYWVWSDGSSSSVNRNYIIYGVGDNNFEVVLSQKSDSNEPPIPFNLLATEDGDILGIRTSSVSNTSASVVTKFNADLRVFQDIYDSSDFLTINKINRIDAYGIDKGGNLWIASIRDLYKFDLTTLEAKRFQILNIEEKTPITDITFSANNILYLMASGQKELIRFSMAQEKIIDRIPIMLPIEKSLYTDGYAVDESFLDYSGRLWFHNYGWLAPDDTWHEVLSRFEGFYGLIPEQGDDTFGWYVPRILLQSSDTRLWFSSENGMSWLDLEKGEWCWFTTYQSNILEDSEHNLWMIADSKLYKLPITK